MGYNAITYPSKGMTIRPLDGDDSAVLIGISPVALNQANIPGLDVSNLGQIFATMYSKGIKHVVVELPPSDIGTLRWIQNSIGEAVAPHSRIRNGYGLTVDYIMRSMPFCPSSRKAYTASDVGQETRAVGTGSNAVSTEANLESRVA